MSLRSSSLMIDEKPLELSREGRVRNMVQRAPHNEWEVYRYTALKWNPATMTNIKFAFVFLNDHHCDITVETGPLPRAMSIQLSIVRPTHVTEIQNALLQQNQHACGVNFDTSLHKLPEVRMQFYERIAPDFGGATVAHCMYLELLQKPTDFVGLEGRFAVRSGDDSLMYPHYCILERYSPKLKSWMQANNDGVCDGRPLSVKCSAACLEAVFSLLYLNRQQSSVLVPVAHEMIELADQWLMRKVLETLISFMRNQVPLLRVESFELLLKWFVSVSGSSADKSQVLELQKHILVHLHKLAGTDAEKRSVIKDQLREFWKASEDEGLELVLKLTETSN